jgi:hypothetical protein
MSEDEQELDYEQFAQQAIAVLERKPGAAVTLANLFGQSFWVRSFAEVVSGAQANDLHRLELVLTAVAEASSAARITLACDFANRVLPVFEVERPSDVRPRSAIAAGRQALTVGFSDSELTTIALGAWNAAEAVLPVERRSRVLGRDVPGVRANAAALAAYYAAHAADGVATGCLSAGAAHARRAQPGELPWQVERVKLVLAKLRSNGLWNPIPRRRRILAPHPLDDGSIKNECQHS